MMKAAPRLAMVLDSVRHWIERYHFDGLRLDAVHAIYDRSRPHILEEIAAARGNWRRGWDAALRIIAETDANDVRLIKRAGEGGYGIDAQWMDDFHHTVHTALTGEDKGYYRDYGRIEDLEKVYQNFLYTGEYSHFWKKNRGSDAAAVPGSRFVVAIQTHDQVATAPGREAVAAGGLYLLASGGGALFCRNFMGEEYAEENLSLPITGTRSKRRWRGAAGVRLLRMAGHSQSRRKASYLG